MGDLGGDCAPNGTPPESTLTERRLEERALREGWQVPDDVRATILKRLIRVLDVETEEGAQAELRYVIAAGRTVIAADLRQQALDLARRKFDAGEKGDDLAAAVEKAERLARERRLERERERDGSPGGAAGGLP